jgi:hypothetical protein
MNGSDSKAMSKLVAEIIERTPWLSFFATTRDLPGIRKRLTTLSEEIEQNLFQYNAHEDIRVYVTEQSLGNDQPVDLQAFFARDDKELKYLSRNLRASLYGLIWSSN